MAPPPPPPPPPPKPPPPPTNHRGKKKKRQNPPPPPPRPPPPSNLKTAELVLSAKVDRKELGKLLRSVRESTGVSQSELARLLGIPSSNVNRLEAGTREGMITTVNRYLQALGWELTLVAK